MNARKLNGAAISSYKISNQINLNNATQESEEQIIFQESYDRASADLEILCAAYPDEIALFKCDSLNTKSQKSEFSEESNDVQIPAWFPLIFTLTLTAPDNTSSSSQGSQHFGGNITMEFPKGYPAKELKIVSYRTSSAFQKDILEEVVTSIRAVARESVELYGGEECGLPCCSAALECWSDYLCTLAAENAVILEKSPRNEVDAYDDIEWITAEKTLTDRKSVFQAHVCVVDSEEMVQRSVRKLIEGSGKIQRATHNMYAYRFVEKLENGKAILKHDNDDDGEGAAGSRLAQLLEMRKEDGILVLVSRWYGGVHLGPKRFAHITNVARELLVECHEQGLLQPKKKCKSNI